jgi:hypothetical protein
MTLVLLGLVTGAVAYRHAQNNKKLATQAGSGVQLAPGEVNYNPPTAEEKQQADDNKQAVSDRINEEAKAPTSSKKTVTVTITAADQVPTGDEIEVYSYVNGVTEDSGTCTAEFVKGSTKITKTSSGLQDATTTICSAIRFPSTELSAGTWAVTVAYQSAKAEGKSAVTNMVVK